MQGSWTEYLVLWTNSLGFIWDIWNFLNIFKSWVWAQSRRSKSYFWVDTSSEFYEITTTNVNKILQLTDFLGIGENKNESYLENK